MDESFFKKYAKQIEIRKSDKQEIIDIVQGISGFTLSEDMFSLTKKQIVFHVSSVVKQKLFQKKVIEGLEEKGYQVKL